MTNVLFYARIITLKIYSKLLSTKQRLKLHNVFLQINGQDIRYYSKFDKYNNLHKNYHYKKYIQNFNLQKKD